MFIDGIEYSAGSYFTLIEYMPGKYKT